MAALTCASNSRLPSHLQSRSGEVKGHAGKSISEARDRGRLPREATAYDVRVSPNNDRWVENRTGHGRLVPWAEIWNARELIGFFALRDLRVRYKQAILGVAWVVVQPAVTVAAFTLAFDRLAGVDSRGLPYPVFALTGLLAWTYLSESISRGSESLSSNTSLVTKVYFPRLIAPMAALLPPMVDLGVGLVLLAVLCVAYGVAPSAALLLLPVWFVLLVLTALGPVLLLAALNVRFRDVRHLITPMLQALLFLSPVAYSANGLTGVRRLLYALNPAFAVLELARFVLIGGPWPGPAVALSIVTATLFAVAGLVYFQRAQRSFADVI
ncbi:MAG: ABC transporter permease [Acidimicrobiales bacterium]